VLFEWLDTLGLNLDLTDESWLLDATRNYLERRAPKSNWREVFEQVRAVRRSNRLTEGWEQDGARLFLAPNVYGEAILIQYLVSRSHTHGGLTLDGRLTLMELIRRLRYIGYLDRIGINEREPGEVFEKLIDYLAASRDWSRVSAVVTGSGRANRASTASGSDRVAAAKKSAKKSSKKSRKSKTALPDPDEVITEPVKLYYLIDRRDFLERAKSVYASYA
jgi:hypothetical protein